MAQTARKNAGERAMTSLVNWVVLGLVIERPSYGLEIAKRLQRCYGDVLSVGDPHVYAALNKLRDRGLVEAVLAGETERQPKPHYRATPAGKRAYADWHADQFETETRRQELWVRQLGVFVRDPTVAVQMLERLELDCLKTAGKLGRPSSGMAADPRTELIDGLVAERQRVEVDGMLRWLRYALARFEGLAGSTDDVA